MPVWAESVAPPGLGAAAELAAGVAERDARAFHARGRASFRTRVSLAPVEFSAEYWVH